MKIKSILKIAKTKDLLNELLNRDDIWITQSFGYQDIIELAEKKLTKEKAEKILQELKENAANYFADKISEDVSEEIKLIINN